MFTNRPTKPWRSITALAVGMALLAACGGDDSSDASDESPTDEVQVGAPLTSQEAADAALSELGPIELATGETSRGVNGKVIRIGGVATLKDAGGTDQLIGACDGAKARFERANRDGGVNGYTIEYVGCTDDGQSPDRNRETVRDLVERDEVFAVIPYSSGVSDSGDYLNENHVPYFGWGVSPVDYCGWSDRQFAFSVTQAIGCTTALPGKAFFSSVGISTYLEGSGREAGDVKAAFVGTSDPPSATAIEAFDKIGTDMGIDVVYAETPIPGSTAPPLADYTPVAQAIISAGPDYVAIPGLPGPTLGLVGALRAGGYTGDIQIFIFDTRLAALAQQLDGVYSLVPNFGYTGFGGEIYDQLADDLEAIDSTSSVDGPGTMTSYGAADLFLQALEQVEGDLTTEALAGVINSGFTYEPPGTLLCPSIWPASHAVGSNCAGLVRFDGASGGIVAAAEPDSYGSVYLFPL